MNISCNYKNKLDTAKNSNKQINAINLGYS